MLLSDDIPVEMGHDFTGRGDASEESLGVPSATMLLFQDRLAQFDALAADVDVLGTLD